MEEELVKVQKLESLGILAGGIAHDFNNIMTAILGNISIARIRSQSRNEASKSLIAAEEGCIRAKALTQQFTHLLKRRCTSQKDYAYAAAHQDFLRVRLERFERPLRILDFPTTFGRSTLTKDRSVKS